MFCDANIYFHFASYVVFMSRFSMHCDIERSSSLLSTPLLCGDYFEVLVYHLRSNTPSILRTIWQFPKSCQFL